MKNLIGFSADNASVMMGNKGGVKAFFCHSMHLCASAATKELPESLEFLVTDINFSVIEQRDKKNFKNISVQKRIRFENFLKQDGFRMYGNVQTESPKVHELLPKISAYYKTILSNFIKAEFIKDETLGSVDFKRQSIFTQVDNNLGAKTELLTNGHSLKGTEIKEIKKQCRNFYLTLCQEIRKRKFLPKLSTSYFIV